MSEYYYVFDAYLQDKKYQTEIAKIEARLSTLEIRGRTEKITILKNIQEAVRAAIKRGAETIVAVGNDQTVTKILSEVADHDLTLGLIPLGPEQSIAAFLGLPTGLAACDVVSRRVIKRLDLGQVGKQYFLLQLEAPAGAAITCDGHYSVSSLTSTDTLTITNLDSHTAIGDPSDGRLELVIRPTTTKGRWTPWNKGLPGASVFPLRTAKIETGNERMPLLLDGQITMKTPALVEVAQKKLSVIVGRQRTFS